MKFNEAVKVSRMNAKLAREPDIVLVVAPDKSLIMLSGREVDIMRYLAEYEEQDGWEPY